MRLRHLRYFLEVAKEKSFTRAAAKVNIESSPLSRAIKDLEAQLGVQLLYRTKGRIDLTWAGEVFVDEARRILAFVEMAQARVKSAAQGYRGHLRVGLADGLAQPNLTRLLARCREDEPRTEIQIFEMTLSEMLVALKHDQLDAGFTIDSDESSGCSQTPVWIERPAFAVPTRHPLLALDRIPLSEAARYPLIMCHPERCASGYKAIRRWLQDSKHEMPVVAQHVSSHEPMMMLVAAGYGIGIGLASQIALYTHPDVIVRPLFDQALEVTTSIITSDERQTSPELERFMVRAREIGEAFIES